MVPGHLEHDQRGDNPDIGVGLAERNHWMVAERESGVSATIKNGF
jgi:hypothetical protein